jgi:4'-phosphopantetheinyl transferase
LYAFAQRRAVGVDCEYVRQDIDIEMVMPLVFSNRELDVARKKPLEDRRDMFFRVWVAKEAYVKATGLGLALDLTKVHIEWDNLEVEGVIEVTGKPDERERWRLRLLPAPFGYHAALVVESDRDHSKGLKGDLPEYALLSSKNTGIVWNEDDEDVTRIRDRLRNHRRTRPIDNRE